MKRKVLVIQPIHDDALALLRATEDIAVTVLTDTSESSVISAIGDAQAVTLRSTPLTTTMIAHAQALRVVSRHGVGYDNIAVEACTERGIVVAVTGPVNAVAVAEHTLYLLLAAARHGIVQDDAVRTGNFAIRQKLELFELAGKTMLIVGYGHIGAEVAKRATAFGIKVIIFDPFLSQPPPMPVVPTLEEGLAQAQIVSLHLPLTAQTHHLLDAPALALLAKPAIVINASRGGLVDEQALAKAVEQGKIFAAGFDTFENEPPEPDSPLLHDKKIVLSPHSAPLTAETFRAMGMRTAENVLAGLQGQIDPALVVNRQVLTSPSKL